MILLPTLCRITAAVVFFASVSSITADAAPPAAGTPPDREISSRPNIIVYMVDDLGWNHISSSAATMGTYPKTYLTPNIERLAQGGLSFTNAYAQPNCAPTRAAMLSGQYPARKHNDVYVVGNLNRFGRGGRGIRKADAKFRGPQQSEDVAAEAITIAEAMQKNGYATAHLGKFHVGGHVDESTLPEHVGFDINLGGSSQGHQPTCFATKNEGEYQFRGVGRGDFDAWAAPYASEYVRERGLPESLVGTPKHISCALGDAFQDTVEKLAAGDKPFYLQFFSYAVHGPVRARPDLKQAALDRLGADVDDKMAEYVGFISGVDENLGRILAALDDPNGDGNHDDSIAANTLVLFTSDNGGTHAASTPLRGVKGMFTEGGIRVPLIAYWKDVIPAGSVTDSMTHVVDYYPTCLELAGRNWMPPAASHPLDGVSFADTLIRPDQSRHREPIFYLFPGYLDDRSQPCVVAIGELNGQRYKLTYFYESGEWELYNLSNDIGETRNLIELEPQIAQTLSKQINAWLTQSDSTWSPKYPLDAKSNQAVGPPPVL